MAKIAVAPLVGARIEISSALSLLISASVAPLVGARIEIIKCISFEPIKEVAPLVGARIEISRTSVPSGFLKSLPSWERGLKFQKFYTYFCQNGRSPRGSED